MELQIIRSQERKSAVFGLGDIQLRVAFRLLLNSDEQDIVDRYRMTNWLMGTILFGNTNIDFTASTLTEGKNIFTGGDYVMLIRAEEAAREACAHLKHLLVNLPKYSGTETISF